MDRRGAGRGKLILFGEHAAVWGYPAAGLPLSCRLELIWTPDDADPLPPGYSRIAESDRDSFTRLLNRLEPLSDFAAGTPDQWSVRSDVPRVGGFGSSAALCTALARTALDSPEGDGYSRSVHNLANELEKVFHGTPSGIDTGMASDRVPALWHTESSGIPRREVLSVPPCHFAVGEVPRSHSTAETVGAIHTAMQNNDKSTVSALAALGDLTLDFAALCRDGTAGFAAGTGRLALRAQKVLSSLGLSTPALDSVIGKAMDMGALGGKMSGGGSGGAYWLVFPDDETRQSVLEELIHTGMAAPRPMTVD